MVYAECVCGEWYMCVLKVDGGCVWYVCGACVY